MSEDMVPDPSADMQSRLSALSVALAQPFHQLRFERTLERQFEEVSQPGRNRSLSLILICAAAIQVPLLFFVAVAQPEVLLLFAVPSVVSVAACLTGAALLQRPQPIWQQNAAVIAPVVAFIVGETFKAVNATPVFSDRMLVTVGLMGCCVNLIFPMRFYAAALCSALAFSAYAGIVLGGLGHLPPNQISSVMFSAGAVLVSLGVAWRNERSGRLAFLLGRRAAILSDELTKLARTDPLTGLANRRVFDEALGRAWQPKSLGWVGLIMVDIDHFKSFNDTAGHAEGDRCLRMVAEGLRINIRETDILARFGGEEFAVVLPRTYPDDAFNVAERLRAGVERLGLPHPVHGTVTVSVGVAAFQPQQAKSMLMEELLKAADGALYLAKQTGRNRTVQTQGPAQAVIRASKLIAMAQDHPATHSMPIAI